MPVINAAYVFPSLDKSTKILSIFVAVQVKNNFYIDFLKTVPAIPTSAPSTVRFDLSTLPSTAAVAPPTLQTHRFTLDLNDPKWQNCDRFDVVVDGDGFNSTRVFFEDCDTQILKIVGDIAIDCPYLALRKSINTRLPKVLIPTMDCDYTSSATKPSEVPPSNVAPAQSSQIDMDRLVSTASVVTLRWLEPSAINAYSYSIIGNTVEDSPSYFFEVTATTPAAAAGGGRKSKQRSGRTVAMTMSFFKRICLFIKNLVVGFFKFLILIIRRIIHFIIPRPKK